MRREVSMNWLRHGNGIHGVPPDGLTLHEAAAPHLEVMEMLLRLADYMALALTRDDQDNQRDLVDTLLYAACWTRFFRDPAWPLVWDRVTLHQYGGDTVVDLMDLFCELFPSVTRDDAREVARSLVYGSSAGV